jgi:two-component sensor histidine kinase
MYHGSQRFTPPSWRHRGAAGTVLALLLSALLSWWLHAPTDWAFDILDAGNTISLILFALTAGLILFVTDALRTEEERRKLLVREVMHRGQNAFAVAQAIIKQTVSADPALAEKIIGRLSALMRTNEMLIQSADQKTELKALVERELKPYGLERVRLTGPAVSLDPVQARAIALVLHELTTNAAKYGALSVPQGHLLISWSTNAHGAALTCEECQGRAVGVRHHSAAHDVAICRGAEGEVALDFRSAGLVARLKFKIATNPVSCCERRAQLTDLSIT